MINVDISNLWTCVSLPELLGSEKDIFDAHNRLRNNLPDGPNLLGWLNMPATASARLIHSITKASEKICANADVLVVCGTGSAFHGAKAAIDLYCGAGRNLLGHKPEILFVGESLSGRQWLELSHLLEDREFSLHIISADGLSLAANVTSRGLRWLLERKYGPKTKERVTVATVVGTPLHKMAQEEGYELFPMPREMGGTHSVLTAAALLPMAVAGIDPLAVLEGAAESRRDLDVRAFDNPAWLYAAARSVLARKGLNKELLCVFDHNLSAFGHWWQRQTWRHQCREQVGLSVQTALLPGDLEALDQMVSSGRSGVFETMLHFAPIAKKVPVEMDWRDYDGLGFLSGRNLDFVEAQTMAAMAETHNYAGVPVLDLDAGELVAETLGELFCFFELSSALTARTLGLDPFDCAPDTVRAAALESMGAV